MTAPYAPVTRAADLDDLDDDEIVEGYRDGLDNEPEPRGNRSRSYYHGWRSGMTDGGRLPKSDEQAALCASVVEGWEITKTKRRK